MQLAFPRVMAAFGSDLGKAQRAVLAFLKLMVLDQELAITTYIAASEEVITRQAHEILEISTPVVQVWDGVVMAPIIGSLDSQRTQQLMERLLQRIVETNSPVALIDITACRTPADSKTDSKTDG